MFSFVLIYAAMKKLFIQDQCAYIPSQTPNPPRFRYIKAEMLKGFEVESSLYAGFMLWWILVILCPLLETFLHLCFLYLVNSSKDRKLAIILAIDALLTCQILPQLKYHVKMKKKPTKKQKAKISPK